MNIVWMQQGQNWYLGKIELSVDLETKEKNMQLQI